MRVVCRVVKSYFHSIVLYFNSKHVPKSSPFWQIPRYLSWVTKTRQVQKRGNKKKRTTWEKCPWMDDFFFPFPNVFPWSNFHGLGSSIAIKKKTKKKWKEKKHRKFLQLITYPSETDMCVCIFSIHHIKSQQKINYAAFMISLMKTCNEKLLGLLL